MAQKPGRAAWVSLLIVAVSAPSAWAWGSLGHRVIAETAALLVERDLPDTWGPLLARNRFQMGYEAVLPDAVFRQIDGARGEVEAPTHFLDLDLLLGTPRLTPENLRALDAVPRGAAEAKTYLESRIGMDDFRRAGSVPWRAAQFLALAREQLESLRAVSGGFQNGRTSSGDARRVYLGLYFLGVMSHYSGDAAVPFHATSDWNGYSVGQGGSHYYFESDCVNAFEPGLAIDVLGSALANRSRWLAEWKASEEPPAGLVIRLLIDSAGALPRLLEVDRRKAVVTLAQPGTTLDALRRPPRDGCRAMRALLVERLAKGAVATARLWETALPGRVDFSGGAAFQFSDFELQPEYVQPDY
jgi:hypothetical protein